MAFYDTGNVIDHVFLSAYMPLSTLRESGRWGELEHPGGHIPACNRATEPVFACPYQNNLVSKSAYNMKDANPPALTTNLALAKPSRLGVAICRLYQ